MFQPNLKFHKYGVTGDFFVDRNGQKSNKEAIWKETIKEYKLQIDRMKNQRLQHMFEGWKNIGVVPDHVQQNNILKAIKQSERRGIAESRYDQFEKHYKKLKTHGFDEWDLYFHEQNIKENVIRSFVNYYAFSIFLSFLLSNSLIKNCFFVLVNKPNCYDSPCAKDIIDPNIRILCKTKRKQGFREKRGRIREIKKEKIPP